MFSFHVAPSAPPSLVRVSVESSTSISVMWGPVSCLSRNGEITGYSLRYREIGSLTEGAVQVISGNVTGGMMVTSGLISDRVYTVEVAAVTSAGTGVYSHPLIFETFNNGELDRAPL